MDQVRKNLEEYVGSDKSVLLFTGDKESTLLFDLVKDMNVAVVFIDTGYHFKEVMDYVRELGSRIEILKNKDASVDYMIDMNKCCAQRKADVLKEYLVNAGTECIIVPFIGDGTSKEIEDSYLQGITGIKIVRPLAQWSERNIWVKIKEDKLPFCRIYKKGYKTFDCKPCTTRHGRNKQVNDADDNRLDDETEEKLKALGYM